MNLRQLLPAALALVSAGAYAPTAHACGGFFCNSSQPVNQAAERIIFSQNADGSTTAVIQIQYSGPSESFAWMLPVVGSPEISVSSNAAMAALQNASNPQYTLTTVVEGQCDDGSNGLLRGASAADSAGRGPLEPAPEDPGVTVVDAGSVGPYDFVIISVDNSAADVGLVATEWLQENEYDVSELGRDRLVPYLESGMNLLAFRLTKGRDAGAIRPVVLNFGEGLPSIPLRPTAAAATDDMGIMVFVVGESRAIPANYLDLELNEAAINWLQPSSNYGDVVTQAANEAGGQGFVTEFVGESEAFEDIVYPEFVANQWDGIRELSSFQVVQQSARLFQGWDGFNDVLLAELTKPVGVSEEDWIANPINYVFSNDFADVDSESFINRVQLEVVDPVLETAALFAGNRTVTRFFTTMSADEMTMDPVFDFNAELEQDVSNLHTATRTIECSRGVTQQDATWRVLFDNGVTVRGESTNWPLSDIDTLPAMRTSRRIGTEGAGEIVTDNSAQIVSTINESNRAHPRRYGSGLFAGGVCSVSAVGAGQGAGSLAMLLGLVGLVALRRRRNV